jgi:hypothetical protein
MPMKTPSYVSEIIESGTFDKEVVRIEKTEFTVYGRKAGGIGLPRLIQSIEKAWPCFHELPRENVKAAWILDVEAPIGGGPQGPFAVGIYFSTSIDPVFQSAIQKITFWEPQPTTRAYIDLQYKSFPDPLQTYVDDMVVHELGHLFFGFGLTTEPFENSWFSLGLGILYDRIAWNRITSQSSPLFSAIFDSYTSHFEHVKEIDQRLINPDTSRDAEHGLDRLQAFGHGKSFLFLSALRDALGSEIFDGVIRQYLSRPSGSLGGYDNFLSLLPEEYKATVDEIENKFCVG